MTSLRERAEAAAKEVCDLCAAEYASADDQERFIADAIEAVARDFAERALRRQYRAIRGEPYGTQWHHEAHESVASVISAAERGEG